MPERPFLSFPWYVYILICWGVWSWTATRLIIHKETCLFAIIPLTRSRFMALTQTWVQQISSVPNNKQMVQLGPIDSLLLLFVLFLEMQDWFAGFPSSAITAYLRALWSSVIPNWEIANPTDWYSFGLHSYMHFCNLTPLNLPWKNIYRVALLRTYLNSFQKKIPVSQASLRTNLCTAHLQEIVNFRTVIVVIQLVQRLFVTFKASYLLKEVCK